MDDHLRNHAFLYSDTAGWILSPAYDLNPTPTDIKPRVLSTAIDLVDPSASIDLAFNVGAYFGVSSTEMKGKSIGWPLPLNTKTSKRH